MRALSIVGVGGTLRSGSSTETVLAAVLRHAATLGAETTSFVGEAIDLPMYRMGGDGGTKAAALVAALRGADAVVLASPAYHGGVSGLVKNAVDYLEDTARDVRPYLTGLPVGCIGTGFGWQGCNSTMHGLRSIAHALRGWPTPLGIALNTREAAFDETGTCLIPGLNAQLRLMAEQLMRL